MGEMIAIRDAYGDALQKLGAVNSDVVVLEADAGSSSKSILFSKKYPERYFNVGIAELNMTAMAAGFALGKMIPFVNTFAAFMTTRASDPIGSLIAYDNLNVKLCGTYSGLSDSYDGASHNSISDLAYVTSLPNMTVISVCDAVETEKAVFAAARWEGPVYLRLSRAPAEVIFDWDYQFVIGKGVKLLKGEDATIIATGYMVQKSMIAAEMLKKQGIYTTVVDLHTFKPIDRDLIVACAKETGCMVVAEEHSVHGGLGSTVAKVVTEEYPVPMEFVGINQFAESGDYEALLHKYHLDADEITRAVRKAISRKR